MWLCGYVATKIENRKSVTILKFWKLQSFKITKIFNVFLQSFRTSWFPRFDFSKFQKHFSKIIFDNSRCAGHATQTNKIAILKCPTIVFVEMTWDLSWTEWGVLASPKINNTGFGAHGHVQRSRNHRKEVVHGSHTTTTKSYKFEIDQNNNTTFWGIYLP